MNMDKLRVIEAFAGVGSQRMALRNIGIEHEVIGIFEIDKYAIKSYNAIHGDTLNYGDISLIDPKSLPDFDLFTYSFPCQDISVAGKRQGFTENSGTRSSLLHECKKIIDTKKPKYLLLENVKNLVGKKFKADFDKWLEYLESLGYSNYWQVMNAKDYNLPQNRERVFVVSILGEHEKFEFPMKVKLEKSINDYLEKEVEDKYYLTKTQIENFSNSNYISRKRKLQEKQYSDTLCARDFKEPKCVPIRMVGRDINNLSDRKSKNLTQQLEINADTSSIGCLTQVTKASMTLDLSNNKIRRLTSKEYWRLMGFSDDDYDKARFGCSHTQLYKQAGNSIALPVLELLFTKMFKKEEL